MLAPVLGVLSQYITQELSIVVWPEEVPRYDVDGNPINPDNTGVSPTIWPVVQLVMEGKANRDNTFEDAYSEDHPIVLTCFGTTRNQVDTAMSTIEEALVQAKNWAYQSSPLGQIFQNMQLPQFWFYDLEVGSWQTQQMRDIRLAGSQLCFQSDMAMQCKIHGEVATT